MEILSQSPSNRKPLQHSSMYWKVSMRHLRNEHKLYDELRLKPNRYLASSFGIVVDFLPWDFLCAAAVDGPANLHSDHSLSTVGHDEHLADLHNAPMLAHRCRRSGPVEIASSDR